MQCKNRKNFLLEGHRSTFLSQKHKSTICDRTPPHLHIKPSLCVQEGSGVTNLQTELNYLDSFKSYCNSSDLGFLGSGGGAGGWGVSRVINYSLYEFRNVQR